MERLVIVNNPAGLHARPATEFVRTAAGFQSKIEVVFGNQTANAKSILSLLKLGIKQGQSLLLRAEGPDEEEALSTLSSLLENAV
jgi:phosphocarrier protein HPr